MRREKYEQYIKQIVGTMLVKGKHKMGYLVVGEKQPSSALLQDIRNELEMKNILSYYVNFNQFDDEESCIVELKKVKNQIQQQKQSEMKPMLVIESFNQLDQRKMEAVTFLIDCQHGGIDFVVSADTPMVHLVGLTHYMIRMNPSESIYSEFYRYSTQKILFSVEQNHM